MGQSAPLGAPLFAPNHRSICASSSRGAASGRPILARAKTRACPCNRSLMLMVIICAAHRRALLANSAWATMSSNTSSRHAWLVGSSLVGGGRPSPFYRPVAAATMMVAPSPLQREHTFAPPPLRGRPHPTPNWCSLIQMRKSCSPHVHYTPVSGVGNMAHVTFMPSPPHPGAPFLVKPIKEPQRGRRCRGQVGRGWRHIVLALQLCACLR